MGVSCEIDVQTPSAGFIPGSQVSGVIRYALDKKKSINTIIISLKGSGKLDITEEKSMRTNVMSNVNEKIYYSNKEVYVNVATFIKFDNNEITDSDQDQPHAAQFQFKLPENIPASLKYSKNDSYYEIDCKIKYKIYVEFVKSGIISFNKTFEKEIKVVSSAIVPRLPEQPTVYFQEKKTFQLFKKGQNIVILRAIVENSVIRSGDKIKIKYEIENNTKLDIQEVRTKMVEKYKFYDDCDVQIVKKSHVVQPLQYKTGTIKRGEFYELNSEIVFPLKISTIECSKMLTRKYILIVTAVLPIPHRNVEVEIPIQIGSWANMEHVFVSSHEDQSSAAAGSSYEQPPSYWQAVEDVNNLTLNEDSKVKA